MMDVVTAIDLSRKTVARIRLNFFFACVYNILGAYCTRLRASFCASILCCTTRICGIEAVGLPPPSPSSVISIAVRLRHHSRLQTLTPGLPIAAGALLWAGVHMSPPVAAAAMMCSSLSVVTSSLLLKRYVKPHVGSVGKVSWI
jgi:cation transport ATPase